MRISSDKWTGKEVDKSGKFVRQKNRFDTPFGEEEGQLPVEAGRYRLLWAPVCPWAHRSIIVRKLLGLEDVISVGKADPKRPAVYIFFICFYPNAHVLNLLLIHYGSSSCIIVVSFVICFT